MGILTIIIRYSSRVSRTRKHVQCAVKKQYRVPVGHVHEQHLRWGDEAFACDVVREGLRQFSIPLIEPALELNEGGTFHTVRNWSYWVHPVDDRA